MNTFAVIFMLGAWVVVLGMLVWSFAKLLRPGGKNVEPPPPGAGR